MVLSLLLRKFRRGECPPVAVNYVAMASLKTQAHITEGKQKHNEKAVDHGR